MLAQPGKRKWVKIKIMKKCRKNFAQPTCEAALGENKNKIQPKLKRVNGKFISKIVYNREY